ncbi:MAG: hypothetical protein NWR72_03450 [Bacteroidia bacterium]|nr:hypothetical protein [Bacteroidia bacterium]
MTSRKPSRNTIVLAALLLLSLIAFILIYLFGGSSPGSTGVQDTDDVIAEIMDLESSILEMELVFEQQGLDLEQKERLLEEKYDEINMLTQRIEEMERQGNVDQATIQQLREQVGDAKGKLLDQYKEEIDIYVIDNSRMTRLIDSVMIVMDKNDSVMEVVVTENITLAQKVEDCSQVATVGPVETRKGIFAEDIEFFARKTNNGNFEPGGMFSQKAMESIKVSFRLVGYGDIPAGLKVLHLVLKKSDGSTYQNPGSSGSWVHDGVNKAFSMQIKAEYNGIPQILSQVYTPASGESFATGANVLEIYTEGKKIGEKRLFVTN